MNTKQQVQNVIKLGIIDSFSRKITGISSRHLAIDKFSGGRIKTRFFSPECRGEIQSSIVKRDIDALLIMFDPKVDFEKTKPKFEQLEKEIEKEFKEEKINKEIKTKNVEIEETKKHKEEIEDETEVIDLDSKKTKITEFIKNIFDKF